MSKNTKVIFVFFLCLILGFSLTGCIQISLSDSNEPQKQEKPKEDVKYSQVNNALKDKYIKCLKIGEMSEFKPNMIVMRDIDSYYFLVPYTFSQPEIANDNNDKYANLPHEGWLETYSGDFTSYTYDFIRDDKAKDAKVIIKKIKEDRYLVRIILPSNYQINTSKDEETISSGKTSTTYFYENAIVYSKH